MSTDQARHRRRTHARNQGSLVALGALPIAIAIVGAGVASASPGDVSRPVPNQSYLAPMQGIHAPVPVAPIAPIAPPTGKIRVGDVQVDTPNWVSPDQSKQVNNTAAAAEAQVATFGDSIGLDRTRSDRLAAATVGDAAVGAAAATVTIGLPLATIGGLIGGVAGLVAGVPFLPAGLVVGPPVGAAIGAAVTAAPFAAIGGAIGAGIGAATALAEPPHGAPPTTHTAETAHSPYLSHALG